MACPFLGMYTLKKVNVSQVFFGFQHFLRKTVLQNCSKLWPPILLNGLLDQILHSFEV
jgi:hypothetical protein